MSDMVTNMFDVVRLVQARARMERDVKDLNRLLDIRAKYHSLPAKVRREVAADTDWNFRRMTGVTRNLGKGYEDDSLRVVWLNILDKTMTSREASTRSRPTATPKPRLLRPRAEGASFWDLFRDLEARQRLSFEKAQEEETKFLMAREAKAKQAHPPDINRPAERTHRGVLLRGGPQQPERKAPSTAGDKGPLGAGRTASQPLIQSRTRQAEYGGPIGREAQQWARQEPLGPEYTEAVTHGAKGPLAGGAPGRQGLLRSRPTAPLAVSSLQPRTARAQQSYTLSAIVQSFHALPAAVRSDVGAEANRRFAAITGVTRELNKGPQDRVLRVKWLHVCNQVMMEHQMQPQPRPAPLVPAPTTRPAPRSRPVQNLDATLNAWSQLMHPRYPYR